MPDTDTPTPSALEQLIAEAETQASTPVINTHPKPCTHLHITEPDHTDAICPTCLWPFCTQCASSLDPAYCRLCLTEQDAELKEVPLKDVDGVQHNGRELIPQGPRFNTLFKSLSEMDDSELDRYIQQYQDLVKQAETALDFRRVVLGASKIEREQRAGAKRRALRSDTTKYPVKTVSIDPKTGKQVAKQASTAKLADMLKMLEALAALKKPKVTAPAAPPTDGVK